MSEGRGSDAVVIRKRGYFYRPGWCGYTASFAEAGRYWRSEADAHAANAEGVTVHELAEFAPVGSSEINR
jgi:hypothetical protein